ncbi:MAG: N-acetylmuramoyl-L-alanine amidase [Actinomycetales bacterium]|nr:N-acetylmuramoyl-L-alanine amidase [Actinomycetales bacterium]
MSAPRTPATYAVACGAALASAAATFAMTLALTACSPGPDPTAATVTSSATVTSTATVTSPSPSTGDPPSTAATTTSTTSATTRVATPTGTPSATAKPTRSLSSAPTPPPAGASGTGIQLTQNPIPYPQTRQDQMAAYSQRHYGIASSALTPKVIVLHFTAGDSWQGAWSTFAANTSNRGEYPGTCAHYVIDYAGVVHQLVPLTLQCRHTIGLNHVAIGIEIVQSLQGHSSLWAEQQILGRPAQVNAALALVRQLQATYGIASSDVIGHATANSHRLFLDKQGWTNDHSDWSAASVATFRSRL